ncbi:HutD family protein [Nocardioides oleivorans]|uniref:HutD family protein n=1 Tax=Nocardioides oleivorans TaxID=273676 RepID=A0A4Q2RQF9_9ACTN|nr:HutD family protein [Nocardioides oleivorans]RYB91117.1 HutD family protein [Nocardioides oleivorans]
MSGTRTVRADEVAPQPWPNGGGTTRELARAGDGSWRISLATIEGDGPFSLFPGLHRLLTVVDGPVLDLTVDGEPQVVEPQRPFAFSGEAEVVASVPEGPVRALNVIAGPGVATYCTVLELGRGSALPLADDQAAYVITGPEQGSLVIGPGEVAGRCTVAVLTVESG